MAVDGYVRGAISQLENALNALQKEINTLQHDIHSEKDGLSRDIGRLDQERKLHEANMANLRNSPENTAMDEHMLEERLRAVRQESDQKKARIAELDAELNSLLQRKTSLFKTVQGFVSQLTSLLASADVH